MRALILVLMLLGVARSSFSQNKTLGVGTPSPNPNAALHIESPTGNQGFIMPRLTTAQRTAMAALPLTADEEGMMVYDKDQKKIFVWSGSEWKLPAKYIVTDPASTDTALTAKTYSNQLHGYAFSAIHKGTGDVAGYFLTDNAASTFPTLYGENRGQGSAVMGNVTSGTGSGVWGFTNGNGGNGGMFSVNNPASNRAGLYGATQGVGPAVMGETTSGFAAVYGRQNNNSNSFAGIFENLGVSNTYPAVQASTEGVGPGVRVLQSATSTGGGVDINLQNTSGTADALTINNVGTGKAISANKGIFTQLTGGGNGVEVINNGTSGHAGVFNIFEATNNAPSIFSMTTGTGKVAELLLSNASSSSEVLTATTNGTGSVATFSVSDAGNTSPAININHAGTGNAITANRPIEATYFIGDGSLLTNLPGSASNVWNLSGNNGTNPLTDFVGTLDNTDLTFKTNNVARLNITKGGGLNVLGGNINMDIGKGVGNNINTDFFTTAAGSFGNYGLGWVTDPWQGSGATAYFSGWGGIKFFTFATAMPRLSINAFGEIGINNDTPGAMLDIDGDLRLRQITAPGVTTNKLYNVSGDLYWNGTNISTGGGSGWGLTGTSGTNPSTDYIGTSDSQDLSIRAGGTEHMRIYNSGQVGIGTTPVSAKFDVGTTANTIGIHAGIGTATAVQNRAIQADASGSTIGNVGVYSGAEINGLAAAIGVYGEGRGTGSGDAFGVLGTTPTGFTSTTGKTYAIYGAAYGGSVNWAGYFDAGNVHIKNALSFGTTDGTFGTPGQVLTSQGGGGAPQWTDMFPQSVVISSTLPLIDLTNSGTGMAASFAATNSSQTFYSSNTGTGKAGTFGNNSSTLAAVDAFNSGTGPALSLSSLTNNLAIDIQQGGVKYSYLPVSAAGAITSKAGVYGITTSVTVTLPSAVNGETCIACAIGAATPTVEGLLYAAGECRVYVYTAPGQWRRIVN